ncbi:MAG: DUF1801 domain-containing protein [Nitrospirae bacterium]|nr:DUF1801 domain-containing protein [Nitrospirota bacterium]
MWTHDGLVCAIGTFKDKLKLNFFRGALLKDTHKLFNAGLEAKVMRAIDFFEGDKINETAIKEIIRSAVAYNLDGKNKN